MREAIWLDSMRKIVIKTSPELYKFTCTVMMLFAVSNLHAAHADAYLNALQDEAADLSVDPRTTANKSAAEKAAENKDLQQDAFESMLDEHFQGTYIFYTRLSDENRALVYQAYTKTPDVNPLRQMIVDLLVNP